MKRILFIISLVVCSISIYGQVPETFGQRSSGQDTAPSTSKDSTTIVDNTFFDIFYGNPGKAAFYGLIIPGGGQIYNKKWWKLPFVYGIEGATIYWIYESSKNYNILQESYESLLSNPDQPVMIGERSTTDIQIIRTARNKWRKQREYSWVIFIGGHLITIFEAFIDRHLMEFDVSDDLTLQPIPSILGPALGLTYSIPLYQKKTIHYKKIIAD